ncbi:hypothetical protein ACFV84_37220 [Kitasatospora sp. NPDC059811]|uniref:hypothetical protein n=1 Tax=Streptomycetaceae TaxID=2062 RepID=UPI0007AFAA3D|nr:hypothetical protein [Streptomyces sp. MJM8645]
MQIIIDTTQHTFEEAMAVVRAAYGLDAQQPPGVFVNGTSAQAVWSHHGSWFVQHWDTEMLHRWVDLLRTTEQLAAAWRICMTPGAWVGNPQLAEFVVPADPQDRGMVRARAAVQVMANLGRREIGSPGGMPFDRQDKGRSAYKAAKPVADIVLEQIRWSALYERLLEEYPAVREQAEADA